MSIFNEDELAAPSWLNESFFEKILVECEKDDDIEVVKLSISPASIKGDHYASIMFRTKVDYRFSPTGPVATKSLIVKTVPEGTGSKRDLLEKSSLFETEIDMYAKTLPAIQLILAEHGDNTKLAPKIVYHALRPNKVIVMEDLCDLGYMVLRDRFPNEEEIKMAYSKLAKLHAVSYKLSKGEQHQLVTGYRSGILSDPEGKANPLIGGGIQRFVDMLSAHDEFEVYAQKLRVIKDELFDSCVLLFRAAYETLPGSVPGEDLFVLNHGDFHLKNLMFKFSKKTNLEDIIMVDYQICVFASPLIDLIYSTYMMFDSPMRLESRDALVHYYFEQFIATLKAIKYEGEFPKFANLQIATIKHRAFAIFMLSTFLPMLYGFILMHSNGKTKEGTNDLFTVDSDGFAMWYRNPMFIEECRKLLPVMLNAGYLD